LESASTTGSDEAIVRNFLPGVPLSSRRAGDILSKDVSVDCSRRNVALYASSVD
jgi:hypothetical protein